MLTRATAARVWGAATAVLGAAMVARPQAVALRAGGGNASPSPIIVRVLGAREVLQGLAVLARPGGRVPLAGSGVDALHAASMLVAARWWPRYRALALTSAAVAGVSAVAGAVISRSGSGGRQPDAG